MLRAMNGKSMTEASRTGLLVVHGNRIELLADAVLAWLASNPLAPLERETILVQSNGMAEWLKMQIATAHSVCASASVELPARFVWRAYRAVLGPAAVPQASPLDKLALTWRLMRLLPELAGESPYEPLHAFLAGGDAARRLQLAQRLADLFDQYQVYRSDWLADWRAGADLVKTGAQAGRAGGDRVPDDQRWQPALWRLLLSTLGPSEQGCSRAELHVRFVDALRTAAERGVPVAGLPRRVVLFGTTHIARQTLDAIAAMAAHCQVLLAVPNPCRFHWADIIDGRELLHFERRRQALRGGVDLSAVALQDMHAHGHPLLAAWGRQSRDFVRQLDAFDDALAARDDAHLPRVALFDDAPATTLLQQVQAAVRDLLPLAEHAHSVVSAQDRSIVFHLAHSAQREVEILHDQLLRLLAAPPGAGSLAPRDIVVMVPDVDRFAPAIRSVFGQYPPRDARYIPWGIADQKERGREPLLVALEWLLRAPHERFGASRVRGLLDVPAVAARLHIAPDEVATLAQWIAGSGVRWGLHAAQRESLGLAAAGEHNTWAFGLYRMLLGYATGELADADQGYTGIEPYAEVGGLEAGLAGTLAELLRTIGAWWSDALVARTPHAWAARLRALTNDLFTASDAHERAVLAALDDALAEWLQACEAAAFDEPVDLAVVREAWLGAVDDPLTSRRFRAGGVTFCTLLPLRAIPFEVVCLLGMNESDYPRAASGTDFDLMALPGQARPGDRSRRDDDRQLMLDALLSARRVLYVSWVGRSQRDNQLQPPSVLVSQLRDYLAAGWGPSVVEQRTTEHPLQPFSRRYFEPAASGEPAPLFTYATQWRAAHAQPPEVRPAVSSAPQEFDAPITLHQLADFVRNPVREFFRHRLQVRFADADEATDDDETFGGQGLLRWSWIDEVLRAWRRESDATTGRHQGSASPEAIRRFVCAQLARLARAGRLPIGAPGRAVQAELLRAIEPMLATWQAEEFEYPAAHARLRLRLVHPDHADLVLDDWLVGLRSAGASGTPCWIELQASKLAREGGGKTSPAPREDKLVAAWLRSLASAACGSPASGVVIGDGAVARVEAIDRDAALPVLLDLMHAYRDGLTGSEPLATAVRTGCAWLDGSTKTREVFEGASFGTKPGEGREACLARMYPDFESLEAAASFETASRRLYAPYREWLAARVDVRILDSSPATQEAGDE